MLANTLYPKNDTKATLTLTQDATGDFTTLYNDINKTAGNLYQLDKDYDFNLANDNNCINGISIDKNNYTIGGKNHIINAKGQSRIFNITGTNVTLKNIKFINANAENGGAIYSEYGVNLINCSFINNSANKSGGAVFIKNNSSNVEITSIFINNTSNNGGAIYISSSITNYTLLGEFVNNTATRGGGAIFIRGTAADNHINALFENNIAKEASGGAIFFYTTCLNSIFEGTFKYNQAMYGAGIFFYYQANNNIYNITFMNKCDKQFSSPL